MCRTPIVNTLRRSHSAIGADLEARQPANPITLCNGHGSDLATITGQTLTAVHPRPCRTSFLTAARHLYRMAVPSRPDIAWFDAFSVKAML